MSNTRHVVIVRRDLNLSAGLLAAQVAHISDAFMRIRIGNGNGNDPVWRKEELEWMVEPYISILAVNNGEELTIIEDNAKKSGLSVYRWIDVIPSKILKTSHRVLVGISIGPNDSDKLKLVTGNLPLY